MIPDIDSDERYVRLLDRADYWAPFAHRALAAHGLPRPERIVSGTKGTYPTMLTDTGLVVKFFGDRWCGPDSHAAESEFYALTEGRGLPMPRVVAAGELDPDGPSWRWPYLITNRIPGTPCRSALSTMDEQARLRFAKQLGGVIRALHATPLRDGPIFGDDKRFRALLAERRAAAVADHRRWGHLPERLCAELDEYLPAPESLPGAERVLVHGDLHADHVFLDGSGEITGIIDFGDAAVADPRYELVVLHLGLFAADTGLLSAFLEGYGGPPAGFEPRAMLAFTLLHDFDVLEEFPAERLRDLPDLDALADLLWRL
ncbi:phosphotransferase family protein [Amycolatopsis anabasis]|uniref:phosphotransferase family protein n=1 Tax=Amycolatopsis anabasis TaxID=1840409 RepID=UPI00131BEF82|nr:aminoglycoside phosphotransferase family protein [Amycolatopsis anabasis]